MNRKTVGVAPGTITMCLGDADPGKRFVIHNPYVEGSISIGLGGLSDVPKRSHIRWDLIAAIGGGSLIIALAAGLVASAID